MAGHANYHWLSSQIGALALRLYIFPARVESVTWIGSTRLRRAVFRMTHDPDSPQLMFSCPEAVISFPGVSICIARTKARNLQLEYAQSGYSNYKRTLRACQNTAYGVTLMVGPTASLLTGRDGLDHRYDNHRTNGASFKRLLETGRQPSGPLRTLETSAVARRAAPTPFVWRFG